MKGDKIRGTKAPTATGHRRGTEHYVEEANSEDAW